MRVMMIAITSLILLTSCGQKGPLYLPQDQSLDKPVTEKVDQQNQEQPDN